MMNDDTIRSKKYLLLWFVVSVTVVSFIAPCHAALPEKDKVKLERSLSDIQKRLVKSAASTQKAEGAKAEVEEKMHILTEQIKIRNVALDAKRKNLAALTQAALHLSQMPPEAMVMMSDNENAIKASRAIKMTSDSIREDMASIRLQTEELKRLQQKLTGKRTELTEKQQKLSKERESLQASVVKRQALQEKLGLRRKEDIEKAEQAAKKSENVQALVSNVRIGENGKKGALRSFLAAKGRIRTPLEGRLTHKFGVSEGSEGTNRGLLIAARTADARVVAPFDGEVIFAGSFLNYGKMIILKHSDDFHTLLAGLSGIDVTVGDFLLEGEPIGAMGDSESDDRLYLELRKNNQPIDPEPWIHRLNKKR